jgi:hypothetical protein
MISALHASTEILRFAQDDSLWIRTTAALLGMAAENVMPRWAGPSGSILFGNRCPKV